MRDGASLWLHKRDGEGGQWFLRYTIHGRRREMGLGSPLMEVTLKEARKSATAYRAQVRGHKDPIKERERLRGESARSIHLLADVAKDAFEARAMGGALTTAQHASLSAAWATYKASMGA